MTTSLRDRAAYRALESHHRDVAASPPARALRGRPEQRNAPHRRGGRPLPRLLEASRHRRDGRAPRRARGRGRAARPDRGDVPRRPDQRHRGPLRPAHGAAPPARARRSSSTAATSSPRCTRCSTGWRAFSDRVRSGEWKGHTGKTDPQRGQHRHRRLRSRPGDGVRGAPPLRPARPRRFASSRTWTAPTSPRQRTI